MDPRRDQHPDGGGHSHDSNDSHDGAAARAAAGAGSRHRDGHSHAHGAAAMRAGARHKGRLVFAFGLLAAFTLVEAGTAVATRSLALLSDAGHMLTDVMGLGMALAAIHLADRADRRATNGNDPASPERTPGNDRRGHRTYGLYRLEILAALANAVLLFGVALYVLVEAVRRLGDPAEVLGGPMLVVALLGLVANLVAFAALRQGAQESLNVEGAYLEVVADTLGSVGVVAAAVVLQITGWDWVDPVVGVAVGLFILPRTWRLGGQAVRILVQAAPPGTDLDALQAELAAIDGVVDVHDLHVWTLTSEMDVASAHLMVCTGTDTHGVLDQARVVLRDGYAIEHATLQVEPDNHRGCDELTW
jgi:cobalt-zinc-cadmium efflux system protein